MDLSETRKLVEVNSFAFRLMTLDLTCRASLGADEFDSPVLFCEFESIDLED